MNARKHKLVAATAGVAVLALAGGVAAQFTTSTQSAPQQIGTGTVALTIDTVSDTVWTQDISNLAAGDSVERFLDLRNSGSLRLSSLIVSQNNTLGDLLTAPSDINVKLESCSVAWNYTTGTCAGSKAVALDSTSVRNWNNARPLRTFEDFGAGDSRHLKITTTLSKDATNAVQGKSGTITYTFGGSQRSAGDFGQVSDASTPVVVPATPTVTMMGETAAWLRINDLDKLSRYELTYSYLGGPATTMSIEYREGRPVYTWHDGTSSDGSVVFADGQTFVIDSLVRGKLYNFSLSASKNGVTSEPIAGTFSTAKDLLQSTWTSEGLATSNFSHEGGATVADATGNIYSFSGPYQWDNPASFSMAERYDVASNTWSRIADLPVPRTRVLAQRGADGAIYLFGGAANNNPTLRVDRYDPKTDSWSQMANMPDYRDNGSSVTDVEGNIYLVGGYNFRGDRDKSVFKYTVASNTWSQVADLPFGVVNQITVSDKSGNIYLVGGFNGDTNRAVLKYSPSDNSWTTLDVPASTYDHSSGAGLVDSSGRIWVFGGSGNAGTNVEVLDLATKTWSAGPSFGSFGFGTQLSQDAQGRLYAMRGKNVSRLG